ncbi:MAG TPA: gliding motility protein GldN [Prolixibacteraceae bacterium]|jgi:gliding motility associated protien GldN|nr:gliding motility protein GldN [Prolixibacteraceae bacterium]
MKNIFVLFASLVFLSGVAIQETQAQIIDGAFQRTDLSKRKPTPLPYVREADVMWSKKVWRIIDLREKMNQPMYFPTKEMEGKNNLVNMFINGIKDGKLTAYDAKNDDEFKVPMTYEQVKEAFGATARTIKVRNVDTGEMEPKPIMGEIRAEEIKQIMLKEEWYFDKQTSTLNVRIIGICPIREYYRDEDVNQETVIRTKVFWIYYPEARELMAANEVFNPQNTARNSTYDDLFLKRMFTSYILKETNIYNNREISQYLTGKEALLESKRIENGIFDYEQNLWEY